MGAPKAKQSSTLRYARLLSFISITFTLFMLGILGLVYALEQGLSSSIQSRMSLTIELSEQEAASPQASIIQLQQAPWVHHVELISADSAARSLSSLLGEDPTKLLGYNPLQPLMKVYLQPAYTHPDSLEQLMKREPILRRSEGYSDQQTQWSSAARNLQTIRYILWASSRSIRPRGSSSTRSACASVPCHSSAHAQASSVAPSSAAPCSTGWAGASLPSG